MEDELFPIIPRERPAGGVTVRLARRVPFAKDVIAEQRERLWGRIRSETRIGFDRGPLSVGWWERNRARVSKVGDESRAAVLFEDEPERFWQRVSGNTKRLELKERAKLGREIGQLVVEEQKILEVGEHAELGRYRPKLVACRVKGHELPQGRNGRRKGGEGVVVDVERGDVGEGKEGGRKSLEVDST